MASRRYSRTVLHDGSMIIKSEVDYVNGLTFQFSFVANSLRPSLTAFSTDLTSSQALLAELAHFLNRAQRIAAGESTAVLFEDITIF